MKAHGHFRPELIGWLVVSLALHAAWLAYVFSPLSTLSDPEAPEAPRFFGTSFEVDLSTQAPNRPKKSSAPAAHEAAPAAHEAAPAAHEAAPAAHEAAPPTDRVTHPAHETAPPVKHAPRPTGSEDQVVPRSGEQGASNEPGKANVRVEATPSSAAVGSFGQQGEPGAPGRLRRAFVKTLPLAAKLDPTFFTLTVGDLGRAVFELELDEDGRLTRIAQRSGHADPALVRAVQKNQVFLSSGRYRVPPQRGARRLLVQVSGQVSRVDPSAEQAEDRVIAIGMRVDPEDPTAEPRGAYFTYGNGQHIEFEVKSVD